MNRLGTAGVLWLVAAGFAVAITLIFRVDPVQWVLTMAMSAVAAVLGLWLVARPSALAVSASNVVAVVWTVLYAALTAQQSESQMAARLLRTRVVAAPGRTEQ